MMKNKKKISLIAASFLMVAAAAVAYQVKQHRAVLQPANSQTKPVAAPVKYDGALLDTLNKIAASLDLRNAACTYGGDIMIWDKSDSLSSGAVIHFLYAQQGGKCYYRYGQTELLNADGVYLYIAHDQHKVLLSAQKNLSSTGVGSLEMFRQGMSSEHYTLSTAVKEKVRTIRLLNERHISCKEYALSYDTATRKVREIYARLPNPSDPGNDAMDKIVDLHFSSWVNQADFSLYITAADVVRSENDEWKLTKNYQNYELVRTQ